MSTIKEHLKWLFDRSPPTSLVPPVENSSPRRGRGKSSAPPNVVTIIILSDTSAMIPNLQSLCQHCKCRPLRTSHSMFCSSPQCRRQRSQANQQQIQPSHNGGRTDLPPLKKPSIIDLA